MRAAILLASDPDLVRAAFDLLSGEIHASLKTALIEDSRFLRDAVNDRLLAAFDGAGAAPVPVMAYAPGGPERVAADTDRFAVWGQGFGGWSTRESDGNAAELDGNTAGFLIGGDAAVGDGRLGLVAGYSHTNADLDDRASSAESDNFHLGVYGGTEWGAFALRAGLAYSRHDIDTDRSVAVLGLSDELTASYDGDTAQAFSEFGYRIDTAAAQFEPFANLAHVHLRTEDFSEDGGDAALSGADEATDVTFTTLGLRAATAFALGGMDATARGMLGWRHAFGDTTPLASLAFAGGDAFTIAGVPVAEDSAVIEAGLDLHVSATASLSLFYNGQFGSGAQDHSLRAGLGVTF